MNEEALNSVLRLFLTKKERGVEKESAKHQKSQGC